MENILIGGSGFIGSHIIEYLERKKKQFRILDIRTPFDAARKYEFCDIRKPIKVRPEEIDTIFHLAALRNPKQAQNELEQTFKTNVIGTFNVCEWARKNDAKRLVFFSSYAVYGNNAKICSESTPPKPCNNYGFSKFEGEQVITNYCLNYGIQCVILRPAPVYGLNLFEGLGATLVINAYKQGVIRFTGNGKPTRQYLHVSDLISAIDLIFNASLSKIEIFNVAGEDSVSAKKIVEMVSTKLNNIPFSFSNGDGAFPGDIINSYVDTSKLKSLGWKPMHAFNDNYPAYIDYVIKEVATWKKI